MKTNLLLTIGGILLGAAIGIAVMSGFRPAPTKQPDQKHEVLMSEMTTQLKDKKGDDFDSTFLMHMIEHHQAAVDMSLLAEQNAKHPELKQLTRDIITAQQKEIEQMKQWQQNWGYSHDPSMHH